MNTLKNNVEHHFSDTYSTLPQGECNDPFKPLWKFAAELFQDLDWGVQVFYSYFEERIDIKIRHETKPKSLEITFEPGYPIQAFTDSWKPNFDKWRQSLPQY